MGIVDDDVGAMLGGADGGRPADAGGAAAYAQALAEGRLDRLALIGFEDPRLQLFLAEVPGAVADHPLVLGQLVVEQEQIRPIQAVRDAVEANRPDARVGEDFPTRARRRIMVANAR